MKQHNPQFVQLVDEAKQTIEEIDIHQLKKMQSQGDNFLLLDVREESEYQNGHIPNATHCCKGILERDIENIEPDFERAIVLYCGGGYRSALAASNLKKMGYRNVHSVNGGFRAWKTAEFDIEHP